MYSVNVVAAPHRWPLEYVCSYKDDKMRPYRNAEEFLHDSMKHGPYIKDTRYGIWHFPVQIHNDGVWLDNDVFYNFVALTSFSWQDGESCGEY